MHGFTKQPNGWYACDDFGLGHSANTFAYAKITFNSRKQTKVKLCLQQYTSSYSVNFGLISNLNSYLTKTIDIDTVNVLSNLSTVLTSSYSDKNNPGQFYTLWINIPAGESFVTIKYRAANQYSNTNMLLFKIEEERDYWYISSDTRIVDNFRQKYYQNISFIYNNKIYSIPDSYFGGYLAIYDLDTTQVTTRTFNYYSVSAGMVDDNSERFYSFENNNLHIYNINNFTLDSSYSSAQVHGYNSTSFHSNLMSCSIGTKIYFINPSAGSYLQIFDIETQTATYKSIPNAMYKWLIPIGSKIYILGSVTSYISDYRNSILVYDIITETYT